MPIIAADGGRRRRWQQKKKHYSIVEQINKWIEMLHHLTQIQFSKCALSTPSIRLCYDMREFPTHHIHFIGFGAIELRNLNNTITKAKREQPKMRNKAAGTKWKIEKMLNIVIRYSMGSWLQRFASTQHTHTPDSRHPCNLYLQPEIRRKNSFINDCNLLI